MQWLLKERWRDSPACDKETKGDTCHPTSCCRVIGGASSEEKEQAIERLRRIGEDKNKSVLSKKRKSVGMERVKKESHESGKEEKK